MQKNISPNNNDKAKKPTLAYFCVANNKIKAALSIEYAFCSHPFE